MDALLRRRAMMNTDKPEFYTYLVFDGTAYIDTDIVPTGQQNTFRVLVGDETVTSGLQHVYDCKTANGRIRMSYGSPTTSTTRKVNVWYDNGTNSIMSVDVNFSVSRYTAILTPNRFFYYADKTDISGAGNGSATDPLVIGAMTSHSGQAYSGKMSRFRIYGADAKDITRASELDNYTPIITLRPCLYKGKAGMWYVEGNKFYGNTAGSGSLTVSNS